MKSKIDKINALVDKLNIHHNGSIRVSFGYNVILEYDDDLAGTFVYHFSSISKLLRHLKKMEENIDNSVNS